MTASGSFWHPLRIYHVYRVLLGLLLGGLLFLAPDNNQSGNLSLYATTVITYLIFALAWPLAGYFLQLRLKQWGALPGIIIEIILITLMAYSSGQGNSNLYILLIITVALGSILIPGNGSYLIASLTTMSVLSEYFIQGRKNYSDFYNITEAAFYGTSFFVTALAINFIARKLRESEKITEQQQQQISRLEALNQQIVQRMRTAIIVFDRNHRILLANRAARDILGTGDKPPDLLPEKILDFHRAWKTTHQQNRPSVQLQPGGPMLMIRFTELMQDDHSSTLVFLEDQRQLAQEAQQLKLASLGKLSATVAHEIRNPLSAINHAADLLSENISDDADRKLLQIITNNVQRVNGIDSDIMNLSRRQAAAAERLNLLGMVQDVIDHWLTQGKEASQFRIDIPSTIEIKFDPGQLSQILHNLVANSFRHAGEHCHIHFRAGLHKMQSMPWLCIRDDGPGISEAHRSQLFDPFFTTSRQGTGLGLYVCRELCEANQAQIDYLPGDKGSEFVITFAHPDRNFI